MNVRISHHVDESEKDANGECEWRYEYDLLHFSDDRKTYVARSYSDDPLNAHFLRKESTSKVEGSSAMLSQDDLRDPLFVAAVAYLRTQGKTELRWLSKGTPAYQTVDV